MGFSFSYSPQRRGYFPSSWKFFKLQIRFAYQKRDWRMPDYGNWHEVVTFRWLEPPPIGCGFPYDLGLENCPYWRPKTCPENPLDRICGPATIWAVGYPSFTKNVPTQSLIYWNCVWEHVPGRWHYEGSKGFLKFPWAFLQAIQKRFFRISDLSPQFHRFPWR